MGYRETRKLLKLGNSSSRVVVLPKPWIDFNRLKEGDEVIVLGGAILVICRPEDENKARRLLLNIEASEKGNRL